MNREPPAHKQTDPDKKPGQIRGPQNCQAAANGGCFCSGKCYEPEKTLEDYIKNIQERDKKDTTSI